VARLRDVDFVVINGEQQRSLPVEPAATYAMTLRPTSLVNVQTGERQSVESWLGRQNTTVHAVAGIGNPQRFFATLQQLGFVIMPQAFPDHHVFTARDLAFNDRLPVVMTAKDAVKCRAFAPDNWWSLEVEAVVPPQLLEDLLVLLQAAKLRTQAAPSNPA
jgi:tetraacyldisaccharide 4'-kinase